MENTPIGLNPQATSETVEGLNSLLADLQVFCQNVRGFHWNIRGAEFFELRAQFEELCADLQLKIDEVAERILTLGGRPLHTYEAYLAATDVHAVKDISNGPEALKHCVAAFSVLLLRERALLQLTGEAGDEGTNALIRDYMREQEKTVWMYRAYLA
ncbi:MAG: DNA starvation/stationary phase protection protein [Flavobacteriales bacterium]|nr:DNA starvation/stationary phase protection protein [Flavobacteriales bacterium]